MLTVQSHTSHSGKVCYVLNFRHNDREYQFRNPDGFAIALIGLDAEQILSGILDIATELGQMAAMHDGASSHLNLMFHTLSEFRSLLVSARNSISEKPAQNG